MKDLAVPAGGEWPELNIDLDAWLIPFFINKSTPHVLHAVAARLDNWMTSTWVLLQVRWGWPSGGSSWSVTVWCFIMTGRNPFREDLQWATTQFKIIIKKKTVFVFYFKKKSLKKMSDVLCVRYKGRWSKLWLCFLTFLLAEGCSFLFLNDPDGPWMWNREATFADASMFSLYCNAYLHVALFQLQAPFLAQSVNLNQSELFYLRWPLFSPASAGSFCCRSVRDYLFYRG